MGYQALLFCPDEKTARTVTQVLNELDFTIEPCSEPFAAVKKLTTQHFDAVVVDCLTLWVSNRLLRGDGEVALLEEAEALATLIGRRAFALTLVSNEVGEGVHPETDIGIRFRDLLGFVNQKVAAACDRVVLMIAGLPVTLKSLTPPSGSGRPDAGALQSP